MTLPVVFMVIFSIIELGFMFRDLSALRGIGEEAARAASISGDDLDADFHLLEVIDAAAAPLHDGAISRIVIYRALSPHDPVPPACLTGGQDAAPVECNSYQAADLARPSTDFGCDPVQNLDRFWCPDERIVIQSAANGGPPDYVGVYLELQRDLFTGMLGQSQTLSSTIVFRLEPRDI
ncbi:MAG: hypothetical protein GY724_02975 [Actinomycetia bacterium]|nr:hypothetical protein [Actinomycetes bacterium]MCP4226551.1 hypothetical protein [Actinomycetes bacterium]MCP5030887.1 hypothetical protein [Actinomycetes bacterium]